MTQLSFDIRILIKLLQNAWGLFDVLKLWCFILFLELNLKLYVVYQIYLCTTL